MASNSDEPVPILRQPEPSSGTTCLDALEHLDALHVHQTVELLEVITGWEGNNKYSVFDNNGQLLFYAFEKSNCIGRQLFKGARGFTLHLTNKEGQVVMRMHRPLNWNGMRPWNLCCLGWPCCACSDCLQDSMVVEAPPGTEIGRVQQERACGAHLNLVDPGSGQTWLKLQGGLCAYICHMCASEFKVMSPDGTQQVGVMTKHWAGFIDELLTKADNFTCTFPVDMDVRAKATMLAALFLIDFMIFEKKQNQDDHHHM